MLYTNRSTITKTFHGVTLKPGETKEIFGTVNDPTMFRSSTPQEPPKSDRSASVDSTSEAASSEKPSRRRISKQEVDSSATSGESTSESTAEQDPNNKEVV